MVLIKLSITKRMNNRLLTVLILFIALNSCVQDKNGVFFSFKDNSMVQVSEYDIYQKDCSVYLHIMDEHKSKLISSKPVKSVEIRFKDSIYKGRIIEAAFSREINLKPFIIYTYGNGKVSLEKKEGKNLIFIGDENDVASIISSIETN